MSYQLSQSQAELLQSRYNLTQKFHNMDGPLLKADSTTVDPFVYIFETDNIQSFDNLFTALPVSSRNYVLKNAISRAKHMSHQMCTKIIKECDTNAYSLLSSSLCSPDKKATFLKALGKNNKIGNNEAILIVIYSWKNDKIWLLGFLTTLNNIEGCYEYVYALFPSDIVKKFKTRCIQCTTEDNKSHIIECFSKAERANKIWTAQYLIANPPDFEF
ncbi:hypothetical protein TetV_465 [Tetraselmis virus 1]|uniref:Uncharacterized protein n=1 Tax=Tetraselmis virus 1 TaxID=2060617 RepID=A0A2P0VNS0_9VIRU|nr:hypothetical protein QJ968_gp589 [Tetraselmis virus 1]AUF82547.1 hypothetical protein TetV_465 [Tetraselmis virus 1]